MKRILLTLLAVIVILGLFAATGYTGYRFGYARGVQAVANGNDARPGLGPFDDFGPRRMPMHRFGSERGWGPGGYPMMGFGFFSVWMLLGRAAILVLVVWFVYWLFTRSGWRLTRTTQTTPPSGAESKNQDTEAMG